jgi:hypothetical protein
MVRKFGSARLHATGAANYRALQLAVAFGKAHPQLIRFEVATETTETTDFYLPTTSDSKREAKKRQLNSVAITISRVSE